MDYPLRENLEVCTIKGEAWIRCVRCSHVLCRFEENWKSACKKTLSPPTRGGRLMRELVGHFLLEQLLCPACGALFNTELVEETHDEAQGRTQQAKG